MARATVQDEPQALGAPGGPAPGGGPVGRGLASSRRDPRAWEAGRSRAPESLARPHSIRTRREASQVPDVVVGSGWVVVVVVGTVVVVVGGGVVVELVVGGAVVVVGGEVVVVGF